jgi:hypothetical protein
MNKYKKSSNSWRVLSKVKGGIETERRNTWNLGPLFLTRFYGQIWNLMVSPVKVLKFEAGTGEKTNNLIP